jgi:hypothetical protein
MLKVLMSGGAQDVVFSVAPTALRDGVFVTAADLSGDGLAEIIVGRGKAGNVGHASLGVFQLAARSELTADVAPAKMEELFTIPLSNGLYKYGARVAVGDLGAGKQRTIIVGAGPMGSSTVQMFDPQTGFEVDQLSAIPAMGNLGVFVAASHTEGRSPLITT